MMARFLHGDSALLRRKYASPVLAFFWISGLMSGVFLFFAADRPIHPQLHLAAGSPVSFPALMGIALLPLLICALAVYLDQHWMIFVCAFGKALLFSHVSVGIWTAFGSAGWLVRLLFLFSDTMMCGLWYLFWLSCLHGTHRSPVRWMPVFSGAVLITGADYWIISPLLLRIFSI